MNIDGAIPEAWNGQIGTIRPLTVVGTVETYECPTDGCKSTKSRDRAVKQSGRWSPWCNRPHYQRDYFRINRSRSHHLVNGKVVPKRPDRHFEVVQN